MNYKIVRIAGIHYARAISLLYQSDPSLLKASYKVQQKALFENAYNYFDSFAKGMRLCGNQAEEIVYDVEPLQKAWALENGVKYNEKNWQEEILLAQIACFKPQVLYFQDIFSLSSTVKKSLKKLFPFIKLIIIFRGFPKITDELLDHLSSADLVLAGTPHLNDQFRAKGFNSYLCYHFFDPYVLQQIQVSEQIHDFTFAGSSGYGFGEGHKQRYWFLIDLLEKTNLQLWIDEEGTYVPKTLKEKFKRKMRNQLKGMFKCVPSSLLKPTDLFPSKINEVIKEFILEKKNELNPHEFHSEKQRAIPSVPISKLYSTRCHPSQFGLNMYDILAKSKITFNKHSNPAEGYVDNIRLFQATGCGTCLITDSGKNIRDLFVPDEEVVVYSSVAECIEKVKFLNENEKIRSLIAKRGQERTLKEHTSEIRCQYIHQLIEKSL